MTRLRKNTMQVVCRIDINVINKLKSINPSLVTKDTVTDKIKFRHGALGKYMQRLIIEDIERREELMKDDVMRRFMS